MKISIRRREVSFLEAERLFTFMSNFCEVIKTPEDTAIYGFVEVPDDAIITKTYVMGFYDGFKDGKLL